MEGFWAILSLRERVDHETWSPRALRAEKQILYVVLRDHGHEKPGSDFSGLGFNIGALIIRLVFWGPLYYNYNKEPPK